MAAQRDRTQALVGLRGPANSQCAFGSTDTWQQDGCPPTYRLDCVACKDMSLCSLL